MEVAVGDEWPAWATQPVEIADPDPGWQREATELATRVDGVLARWRDGATEHVGSTAVPGLPAKPVIDLMAPVRRLADVDQAHDALADAGWQLVPPARDRRPWRRLYVLPDGGRRRAHLHVVERSHPRWRQTLAFRDRLRRRADLADAYADVKRSAARAHRDDREAYTAAKAAFVARVLDDRPGASTPR